MKLKTKLTGFFGSLLKYFWKILIVSNGVIFLLTYVFLGKDGVNSLYTWFKLVSLDNNSNLITISTVLIGIYFSLLTYILSADINSIFSKLDVIEFKYLIRMITIGFVSSMLIVLLSFTNDFMYDLLGMYLILINYILFILIFGSLIEISIYYSLIFKHDLDARYKSFELSKIEEEENRKIKERLKSFLEKQND